MKFSINLPVETAGVLVRSVFKNELKSTADLAPELRRLADYAVARVAYKAEVGEVFYLPNPDGQSEILLGLGDAGELNLDKLREIFFKLGQSVRRYRESPVHLPLPPCSERPVAEVVEGMVEGLLQATYCFDKYKKKPAAPPQPTTEINLLGENETEIQAGVGRATTLISGIFTARDLVNERANVIYPKTLAEKAVALLEPLDVKVSVYKKKEIKDLGMEAFLSVARGSDKEPRLIVMEYTGRPDSEDRTALVGKGLTYDSGGYSLKPSTSMDTMFCDMAGAATVIGAMEIIARLKLATNVTAVVAACENLVNGDAYKPGDIISSLSGQTIEVVNTDAEGRLTLADAVYYATAEDHLNCSRVVDLATLTGACLVALGEEYTALVSNNKAFTEAVKVAADRAGERVWELPADRDFADRNQSKVADLVNSGGRLGGTISAGLFVGAFVAGEKPWVHFDIAGTAYLSKAQHYLPEGATGVHVKTLVNLVSQA